MPNKSTRIYPPEFDWWPSNQGRAVFFMVIEFNWKSTLCHGCRVLTAICSYVTKAVRNILKLFFFPSVIGTSSLRRAAQLKKRFPQLEFENIVSCTFLSYCVCGCLYIINGSRFHRFWWTAKASRYFLGICYTSKFPYIVYTVALYWSLPPWPYCYREGT